MAEITPVTLTCKHCGHEVQRATLEPSQPWVHADDYVSIINPTGIYDHEPVIEVLEVQSKEKPE